MGIPAFKCTSHGHTPTPAFIISGDLNPKALRVGAPFISGFPNTLPRSFLHYTKASERPHNAKSENCFRIHNSESFEIRMTRKQISWNENNIRNPAQPRVAQTSITRNRCVFLTFIFVFWSGEVWDGLQS